MYAQSVDTRGNARCFYQFHGMNEDTSELNIEVKFESNTAYFAGSALYGGSIDFCTLQSNAGIKPLILYSKYRTQMMIPLLYLRSIQGVSL